MLCPRIQEIDHQQPIGYLTRELQDRMHGIGVKPNDEQYYNYIV